MAKKIRKGDEVVVISGSYGKKDIEKRTGKVLYVDSKKNRLIIEGINLKKVAMKRTAEQQQGGFMEKECPIHRSNVMLKKEYEARKERNSSSK